MGMKYKGLDAKSELSLQVVTPKGKDTIYTFTVVDKADYYGEVFIDMSTEEVTRLRDELSFILEHDRLHAEAAEHKAFAAEAMKEALKHGPLLGRVLASKDGYAEAGLDAYTATVQQIFAKAGFTETPIGEYPIAEMFLYGTPLDVVFSVGSDVACGFHINDVLREQVHPFVVNKKWVGPLGE